MVVKRQRHAAFPLYPDGMFTISRQLPPPASAVASWMGQAGPPRLGAAAAGCNANLLFYNASVGGRWSGRISWLFWSRGCNFMASVEYLQGMTHVGRETAAAR